MLFYIFVLFFCFLNRFGSCCECRERSEESLFCSAGFVMRATVISKEEGPRDNPNEYVVYTVKPIKIYKGGKFSNQTKIRTPGGLGMCGAELSTGNVQYLLSGASSLNTDMCQLNKLWDNVSSSLKQKLNSGHWNCTAGDDDY